MSVGNRLGPRKLVAPFFVWIAISEMSRLLPAVASFTVAAILCVVYWHWLGQPVALPDLPGGRFQCLSYSPYDGNSSPLDADFDVPRPRIAADIALIKGVTGCIRTYSAVGVQGDVTRIAHDHGMQVLQGIWISGDPEANEEEIAAAVDLVHRYPGTIRGIFVGNEVLLRREMDGAALVRIIERVRRETGKPVLYADVPHFWKKYPEVAKAVDIIAIHILPYWDDPAPTSIAQVQQHVAEVIADTRATFPGKQVMIGEIGWPSAGRTRGGAVPGRVNQARFIREFVNRADALGVPYNLIEAIDQPWKRVPEGTVGGYWGIFDQARTLKFPLTGPVREWPHWRRATGLSLVAMALFLAWGFLSRRMAGIVRWSALAVLALVTGVSLVRLAEMVAVTSLTAFGWISGGAMAAATALAAGLIVARIEGRVAPGAAALAEVIGTRGWRGPWPVARRIAAFYWVLAVPVAMLALTIGFDGRHRDLPSWGLWLPGLALAVMARGGDRHTEREKAWLTLVLAVSALLAFDGWRDVEAMLWGAAVLLFAVPGWRDLAAEAKLLASAVKGGRAQQPQYHGDRG